jgi:hypothetical protein
VKKVLGYALVPFILAAAMIFVSLAPLACSGTSTQCKDPASPDCTVLSALVDCTGVKSLDTAVAEATPLVLGLVSSARASDGSINWSSIESRLVQLAWQYGMCVIAEIWNMYFSSVPPPPVDAGIDGSAATQLKLSTDPVAAKAAFERIRNRVAPHTSFKTKGGTL